MHVEQVQDQGLNVEILPVVCAVIVVVWLVYLHRGFKSINIKYIELKISLEFIRIFNKHRIYTMAPISC